MPLPTAAELTDPNATNTQMKQRLGQLAENVESKDDSIARVNTLFEKIINKSENLFNKDSVLQSTSIDEDGTIIADPIRWLSDYIECAAQEVFSITSGSYRVAYFDADKNFIIRSGIAESPITVLDRPAIKYMRLSSNTAFETLMLNKGSVLLPYDNYGDELHPELLPSILPEKLPVIEPKMTSFFETSNNLFNKSVALLNTSIELDGSVVSDSARWLSDYIAVTPESNISLPNASFRIACYGPLKNFINRVGVAIVESDHIVYTIRSDTHFIRLSGTFSVSDMHMNHGNELHPFEEFGKQYLNNDYLRVVETNSIPNIEPKMTSFFDLSRNLFDKNTVLPNTSLDEAGVIVADPIRWLSDYIECTAREVFSLPGASYRVAYYDKDKNFIIRSGVASSPITVLNRPEIKYMRLSSNVAFETLMLNKGSTLLPYEVFGTALIKQENLPETINVDVDKIADEVQQRIGSGLTWQPSFPTLSFEIVESGTWRVPMWMNESGTIIYGAYGDQLVQSTDEWATRTQIGTTGFVRTIAGVRTLDDGELLVSTNRSDADNINSKVYKTVGYDPLNPSAATFKEVLTTGATQENINNRWGLSVYQNICVASGYGLKGPDGAQNVYLSTDYGDTWKLIFNLRTQVIDGRPPLTDTAHVHTSAYDPYFNRIWVAVGDKPNTATYYSDDLGETWTFVKGTTEVQYTGIIALPDSVIFGSDRAPNGVYVYHRKDRAEMPVIKPLFLINNSPTITHVFALPFKKDWKPDTPVYFAGNNTTTSTEDKPVIMGFVDGNSAHLLYEHPAVDSLETALGPTAQGNIISIYTSASATGKFIIKAKAPNWTKI